MILGLVNELRGALGTGYGEETAPSLASVLVTPRALERPCRVKEGRKGVVACCRKSQAPGDHWHVGGA